MHRAANLSFERIVDEFVRWREVPEHERSPAPAWWWGPAFEVLGWQAPLPVEWCAKLELAEGATYAEGAGVFLKSLAGQSSLPWPGNFPRRPADSNRSESPVSATTAPSSFPASTADRVSP
ncbi:hypothetical protein [Bradyrhizobium sp.]|uniref:hypothetical protein n=1 Tax=Bradyrhizobium sp. TaxID=376 RepID=UPI00271EBFF9|nr:hypothetical protein [Bradyrhizobium sp.]MDO9298394.1 hypothetical protein [Bradyrhizobium sp.]